MIYWIYGVKGREILIFSKWVYRNNIDGDMKYYVCVYFKENYKL